MPASESTAFRMAVPEDADAILKLLGKPAEDGLILPRTRTEITALLGCFIVAESDGHVVGCVTLTEYGSGLYEIRSLVVEPCASGQGIGSRLVDEAVYLARSCGAERVFALTYRPHLFERLAFHRVNKSMFPQKVWDDCSRCPKRQNCDETALLLNCDAA